MIVNSNGIPCQQGAQQSVNKLSGRSMEEIVKELEGEDK